MEIRRNVLYSKSLSATITTTEKGKPPSSIKLTYEKKFPSNKFNIYHMYFYHWI